MVVCKKKYKNTKKDKKYKNTKKTVIMYACTYITAVFNDRIINLAVSYFIVYRETASCNNAILKEALNTNDFDVRAIRSRPRGGEQNTELVSFRRGKRSQQYRGKDNGGKQQCSSSSSSSS